MKPIFKLLLAIAMIGGAPTMLPSCGGDEPVDDQVDKTALNSAIATAEALTAADYTTESWAALVSALSAAKAVARDPGATESEVAKALSDLNTARGNLVPRTDGPDPTDPYADLAAYDPLISYVDFAANPGFKLGLAVEPVSSLVNAGTTRDIVLENFNEVVAGNAMKYASVVSDGGTMNFSDVTRLVAAARDANLSLYGHTLVWHSQQRRGYLNGLIGPKVQPTSPDFGAYALKMTNTEVKTDNYLTQIMYTLSGFLTEGTTYTLKFKARATVACEPEVFLMSTVSGAAQNYPGTVAIGTELAEVSIQVTPTHGQIDRFSFNIGKFQTTILLDDISLTAEGSDENLILNGDFENGNINGWSSWQSAAALSVEGSDPVEMTAEEKREILTDELERWIKGMMEATGGYVKAWDLVNEAMSDTAPCPIRTDPGNEPGSFYWQDYLGENYGRVAAKLARQYGGDDLLLFVNDYNLEGDWYADNDKLKSMIAMVERWESDGVTRIDGLGTQMHVIYNVDPASQKRHEDAVVRMFELMAATGKLVKISELDMRIENASGQQIPLASVTAEQHRGMADYYEFIISKYFEIIPPAQRYGITQWSPTDNPNSTGWQPNQPNGLWTTSYQRKPAYAGFANGLKGAN